MVLAVVCAAAPAAADGMHAHENKLPEGLVREPRCMGAWVILMVPLVLLGAARRPCCRVVPTIRPQWL